MSEELEMVTNAPFLGEVIEVAGIQYVCVSMHHDPDDGVINVTYKRQRLAHLPAVKFPSMRMTGEGSPVDRTDRTYPNTER